MPSFKPLVPLTTDAGRDAGVLRQDLPGLEHHLEPFDGPAGALHGCDPRNEVVLEVVGDERRRPALHDRDGACFLLHVHVLVQRRLAEGRTSNHCGYSLAALDPRYRSLNLLQSRLHLLDCQAQSSITPTNIALFFHWPKNYRLKYNYLLACDSCDSNKIISNQILAFQKLVFHW